MFAYCGNNPIIREDRTGTFFNTICGTIVGAVISAATRSDNESLGEALWRGAVTGAIAGAGLDICVATGGVGGLIIAGALGAGAAVLDTVWESKNNDSELSASQIIVSGAIGCGMNVLFGAAGRVAKRVVGKTAGTVLNAIWDNTVRSVTSNSRKFVLKKFISATVENMAYSTIQGAFSKIYTEVGNTMMEALE
jgi:hypothetical protein